MKTDAISDIHAMLPKLPARRIQEVRDYISFLIAREKKHEMFVKRVLEIDKNSDTLQFESVEEAMEAIRNWEE